MTGPPRPARGQRWTGPPAAATADRQRRRAQAEQRRRLDEQRRELLARHVRDLAAICGPLTPPPLQDSDIEAMATWAPTRHRPDCDDSSCRGWPCAGPFDRPSEPGRLR